MPKKILLVVTEDWYFCSHRLNLAKAAMAEGFEVAVATRVKNHGEIIQQAGIKLIPLLKMRRSGKNPWHELKSIYELMSVYRSYQPFIVHHVAMKPMLYGTIAAWLSGVRYRIQAISGFGFVFLSDSLKAKFLRVPIRILLRWVLCGQHTHVIVQNADDSLMAKKLGVAEKHIHLIAGSGIDIEMFYPLPEPDSKEICITLVARMLWDKGVGEFVEATRLLKKRGVKFRAVLIGEPDTDNPSSITVKQLELWNQEGIVEWRGRCNDIIKVWESSHIAVLPSYREGLPKSLLEAASCARPMIATDAPGCRSVVIHEKTGLLVPVKNAVALAEAMEKLIANGELRQYMAKNARASVEQLFADDVINKQILHLYKEQQGIV